MDGGETDLQGLEAKLSLSLSRGRRSSSHVAAFQDAAASAMTLSSGAAEAMLTGTTEHVPVTPFPLSENPRPPPFFFSKFDCLLALCSSLELVYANEDLRHHRREFPIY